MNQLYFVGATIGFFNTSYSVLESEGQLNIQLGVISGSLQREVEIAVLIIDASRSNSGKQNQTSSM